MHLPPQLLVALEAGGEARLGEAVGHGWAVSWHGIKMTGSSLPSASPHPLHSKSSTPYLLSLRESSPSSSPVPSGVLTPTPLSFRESSPSYLPRSGVLTPLTPSPFGRGGALYDLSGAH